ncbi:MAG: hypothetical protein QOF48_3189, partial [Verrucomicrobiota bacterium]
MSADSSPSPREELEARITALLLGELSEEDAAALRVALDRDPELARLHDRLARTIGLMREAAGSLNEEANPPTEALQISSEKRDQLLASFKVVRPKDRAKRRVLPWKEWAALAAMLIGLLIVVAMLNLDSRPPMATASTDLAKDGEEVRVNLSEGMVPTFGLARRGEPRQQQGPVDSLIFSVTGAKAADGTVREAPVGLG